MRFFFIIYDGGMMGDYNGSRKPETMQNMPSVIRNEAEEEQNWANYLHMERYRGKGDRHRRRPAQMNSNNVISLKMVDIVSDDAMIKTAKLAEIYEKLTKYENATKNTK